MSAKVNAYACVLSIQRSKTIITDVSTKEVNCMAKANYTTSVTNQDIGQCAAC